MGVESTIRVRLDRLETGNQWHFPEAYYNYTASHSGLAIISLDAEHYAKIHEQKTVQDLCRLARHELRHHLDLYFLQQFYGKIRDFSRISHDAFLRSVLIHARVEGFAEAEPEGKNFKRELEVHTSLVNQALAFLEGKPQPYNLYTGALAEEFAAFRNPKNPGDLPAFNWYAQGKIMFQAMHAADGGTNFSGFLRRMSSLSLQQFYSTFLSAVNKLTGSSSNSIYPKKYIERTIHTS